MTPTAGASFSRAMDLRALDPCGPPEERRYAADLSPQWTIGPKIHGGIMAALCARAAHRSVHEDPVTTETVPLALSASFLSAPDPGPVQLWTTVRKRGRRINLVDVELVQHERVAVRAVVTVGIGESSGPPLLTDESVIARMGPEPPVGLDQIGPGHPAAEINHLAAGCDIRPDMASVWTHPAGVPPLTRTWIRPRGEPTDLYFALVAGDISMPVTFAVGRTGWAPTVQLTAYLRAAPVDGWLRVSCTTTQIGETWFDADHTVVDSAGRIVVQTRQLAMVPAP